MKTSAICQLLVYLAVACFFLGFLAQIVFQFNHTTDANLRSTTANIISQQQQQQQQQKFQINGRSTDLSPEAIQDIIDQKAKLELQLSRVAPPTVVQNPVTPDTSSSIKYELSKSDSFELNPRGITEVPNIVKSWRNAKIDWHQLLPSHTSLWARFGVPVQEGKLRLLVSKEMFITDYLTRFMESGLSAKYGHDYGPLQAYSGCNVFRSGCMIHDQEGCGHNDLCSWSSEQQLCVDAATLSVSPSAPDTCAHPQKMTDNGFVRADPAECKVWTQQRGVLIRYDSEAQSMFYHWWAAWGETYKFWVNHNMDRNMHFFMDEINDPMFFSYLGFISDNCWRHKQSGGENEGICFCNTEKTTSGQAGSADKRTTEQMVSYLGLSTVAPPATKPKIGIISRRVKRFILNEYELYDAVIAMGFECELLPLERMTLFEQMRALRSVDVLVGIHGSALYNSVFLQPGSVLVQLLPYNCDHRLDFGSVAVRAGMKYMDWMLKDKTKAYFHWDLLDQADKDVQRRRGRDAILAGGSKAPGVTLRQIQMFWINQDIIVPLDEWRGIIVEAVKKSPASARGANINAK